ncbi:MAG TPA: CerR family C-terminal domain-containing protein [Candidatus Hydrogenedens sp.]|nr:CerR family C-terminal domain-containing protein [Candidatus Hydrogenedens sp.]
MSIQDYTDKYKKLELIETAGPLFAELGLKGTSIRSIADKCKVNIASINYYFGSKENFYTETLRYVAWQVQCPLAQKILKDPKIDFSSKKTKCQIIQNLIKERVQNYLSDKYPMWYAKLLLRSLIEPPTMFETVISNTFIPELNALVEVIAKCVPEIDKEKCKFWAFSILGEISFYVFAEPGIKMSLGLTEKKYNSKILEQLQNHITGLILKGLGLT